MKFLFAYGYTAGTTPYYYERILKREVNLITCGPSTDPQKKQDIPCSPNADILPIIKKTEPNYLLLFPEGKSFFLPKNIEKVTIPKILLLSDTFLNYYWQKYYANLFDVVFLAQKKYFYRIKENGVCAWWLPHACEPEIHKDFHLPRTIDISFVGSIDAWQNPKRSFYLEAFKKNFDTKVYTNLYFEEMARIYSQSKIVINISADQDQNMRFFETMSCGAFLLTDYIPSKNLNNLFIPGTHFAFYHSLPEAIKLANFYLSHSKERKKVAKRGQEETLKHHTYQNRVQFMLQTITSRSYPSFVSKDPSEDLRKSYLYLNHPSFKPSRFKKEDSFSLSKIVSKLPYNQRRIVVSVFTKINIHKLKKITIFFYYQLFLQLNKTSLNKNIGN